jgi:L-aspartate oxidase
MADRIAHDGVLIVGAGLAGLSAALAAAPRKVLVLTGAPLNHGCSSAWAQGGMAAALGGDDTAALHAPTPSPPAPASSIPRWPALLAEEGPEAVRRLAGLGAPFDRDAGGAFAQSLEAAHSRARIARVLGDQAGRAIMEAAAAAALAAGHIEVRDGCRLRGLLQDAEGRIRGVVVQRGRALVEITARGGRPGHRRDRRPLRRHHHPGGAARRRPGPWRPWPAPSSAIRNSSSSTRPPSTSAATPAPLATEALRGEGARLVDGQGRAFMAAYHPDAELAPRDVVARAIHAERLAGRGAFLDAREAVGEHFPEEFPGVFAACLSGGIDPRTQPIPVAPACHYHMGGIVADAEGRTSLSACSRPGNAPRRRARRQSPGLQLSGGSRRVRPPRRDRRAGGSRRRRAHAPAADRSRPARAPPSRRCAPP